MAYAEAANFLFDLRRFRTKPGTESTARLLKHLGDPQVDCRAIQIAGTNGKGSTAGMLASILREAGLDVGLYTSPHLEDLRDRVQVNGRPMAEAAVEMYVDEVREYVTDRATEGESPTFFEVVTSMALWHFAREGADIAILEVGIGGRHDATSVVSPDASAVTNVSLEHTEVLGDTVEDIARDKASVAPTERPLVTAARGTALATIRETAADVLTVGPDGDITVEYDGIPDPDRPEAAVTIAGPDWCVETRLALLGAHQALNAGVAAALARQIADVDPDDLAQGLRSARWPGRFEIVCRAPLVVLDGAHNPGACETLADTLGTFDYEALHLVYGALFDKDHHGMAAALSEPDRVVACQPDVDRAEDRDVLAAVFEQVGVAEVQTRSAVEDALAMALDGADPDDAVLVTGSLYTVREARRRWTRRYIPKRVQDIEDARRVLDGAHVTPAGVWRMRGKGVHRVLRTRVQPRQAQYLKEELLSLGGECALSGVDHAGEETIDAVMMGTLAQFKRLCAKLEGQSYGLPQIAEDVREALRIATTPPIYGYPWEDHTAVMGVLNVTPNSFHDGGEHLAVDDAVAWARSMVDAGADIVDIGGESTRPGATPVPPATERDRVVPVIEELIGIDAMLSIDTRRASVAEAALDAGADVINDVSGLADPEMRFLAADEEVPVVVTHSIDVPVDPDRTPRYDDVVDAVLADLRERVLLAETAGVEPGRIIVDPGLGFGKTSADSFALLDRLGELRALGHPILVGHSHKSMFGSIGRGPGDRHDATVAATALAADRGADIVRVHDVAANVDAIRTVEAASRSAMDE